MNSVYPYLRKYWYALLAFAVLALITSIRQANLQDAHGDPYIFWAAGGMFMNNQPLYVPIPGAQEFIYPPVAAWLFQLLAIFPFPVATGLFTAFNFLAWLALIGLTYGLLSRYFPGSSLRIAMLVGVVATIRYFWHNIVWVNVNEGVALLSVGGLFLYGRGRQNWGLLLLTLAMWVKVMPLLLLLVLLIRRPWPTLWRVLAYSAGFGLLIMLQRGPGQAVQDYLDFWHVAFKPFLLKGRVYTDWIAFGISATLAKLLTAHPDANGIQYHIVSWSPAVVGKISVLIRLALVSFTYYFAWRTRRQNPLPALILAFLTMLLVAGVSWEGHHVTLLVVIAGLYQLTTELGLNALRRVLAVGSIGVGLLTPDLIGGRLSDYLQAYSLITYNVLLLYGIGLVACRRFMKQHLVGAAQPMLTRTER